MYETAPAHLQKAARSLKPRTRNTLMKGYDKKRLSSFKTLPFCLVT